MPKIPALFKNGLFKTYSKFLTKTLPLIFLSCVLFLGGIWLLALRLPGWSLLLGLPSVLIGLVFLIFTVDEVARHSVGLGSLHQITCSVCGRPTLAPYWQKEKICAKCRLSIGRKLKSEKS